MKIFKGFLNIFIKSFLLLFVILICVLNISLLKLDNSKMFFYSFLLVIFTGFLVWLYKSDLISKKIFRGIVILYFILGIGIRLVLINGLNFKLESDFELYFNTAKGILFREELFSYYLSFNGYVYVFSSILAVFFKLFGVKIITALGFNLLCSIASCFFLYKIINMKSSKETSLLISAIYFLLPNVIFSNILVSTESLFMLLFFLTIYVYYKTIDKKEYTFKGFLKFIALGLLISFTNNIRPVMLIFIIALCVCYFINLKKAKELLLLGVMLIVYFFGNFTINMYVENGIGTKTRSGALGWSIYFGANYDSCGMWTEEDSIYVFDILKDTTKGNFDLIVETFNRLKSNGMDKNYKLLMHKFKLLWQDSNSSFDFVSGIVDEDSKINIINYETSLYEISCVLVSIIMILSIISISIQIKTKSTQWLFIELFSLGYILANMIVCVNGRYNLPLYPLLLICSSVFLNRLMDVKNNKNFEPKVTHINKKEPKVLLIVPAYNEEESIQKTITSIISSGYDYIIINDGSIDKTEDICKKNNYNFISLPLNLGIGGAVQTGYKYALENGYDIAVQFDADGQHDIKYIHNLISPIVNDNVHFVIGSRFIEQSDEQFRSTKMRRMGIKIISFFIKLFSNQKICDTTSGFRAANIDIIRKFSYSYPIEYPEPVSTFELLKQGYRVKEVAVKMYERQGGKTSISSWKNVYYMFNVIAAIIILQIRGDKK